MNAVSIKVGIGFVVAVVVVEILQIHAVLDALFVFIAAGIVPGTNIIVSPDAIFYALSIVMMFSIALIVRARLSRLRQRKTEDQAVASVEQPSAEIIPTETVQEASISRRRLRLKLRPVLSVGSAIVVDTFAGLQDVCIYLLSLRRPLIRQFDRLQEELGRAIVGLWHYVLFVTKPRQNLEAANTALRDLTLSFGAWLIQMRMRLDRWLFK